MPTSRIPNQPLAKCEIYDSILRWEIPSRTPGQPPYVVDLGAYEGHGECVCKDFATRFGPFLSRGVSPEEALEGGWVDKLREYQLGPEDALSCFHLVQARRLCARAVARAFAKIERAQTPRGETRDGI